MRLFDMFLRRAGLTRADALRRNRAVSRLTIECPENMLSGLRQRIYADFRAAGLNVSQVQIQRGEGGQMASACVTVDCPADKRAELVSQARRSPSLALWPRWSSAMPRWGSWPSSESSPWRVS